MSPPLSLQLRNSATWFCRGNNTTVATRGLAKHTSFVSLKSNLQTEQNASNWGAEGHRNTSGCSSRENLALPGFDCVSRCGLRWPDFAYPHFSVMVQIASSLYWNSNKRHEPMGLLSPTIALMQRQDTAIH